MYGNIPYMIPNMGIRAAAPMASGLANAANLGNTANAASTAGTSLIGKINWSSLLSNAQKTLNVVNQAIPLYYQVKPVFKNIRTLGQIGKEFTKINNTNNVSSNSNNVSNTQTVQNKIETESINTEVPEPKFFL